MRVFQRNLPRLPALLFEVGGIEPFSEVQRLFVGGLDCLGERLRAQTLGHRINRLDRLQLVDLIRRQDMIWMGDLRFAAVAFDPAADDALFADGKDAVQVVLTGVEEDQGERSSVHRSNERDRGGLCAANGHAHQR